MRKSEQLALLGRDWHSVGDPVVSESYQEFCREITALGDDPNETFVICRMSDGYQHLGRVVALTPLLARTVAEALLLVTAGLNDKAETVLWETWKRLHAELGEPEATLRDFLDAFHPTMDWHGIGKVRGRGGYDAD